MSSYTLLNRINLYRFVHNGTVYTWTGATHQVDYNSETYLPAAIKRGTIEQSSEQNRGSLTINIPRDNPLGVNFISKPQDWPVAVTVFEQDSGTGVTKTIWVGRVSSHSASGSDITLECETGKASQRRSGMRARYQKTCRHALYQRGCNLVAANFASAGNCTLISGTTVVVPEAGGIPSGELIGGMIEYGGVQKYIKNHVGITLTLMYPFSTLEDVVNGNGSVGVTLYLGCAHNFTTCLVKFNNLDNFGGFPWIPNINPFTAVSIY